MTTTSLRLWLAFSLAFLAVGCASSQSAYNKAVAQNTFEGYADFLVEYPDDPLAEDVREILAFKKAEEANSSSAWKTFLDEYPESSRSAEAREHRDRSKQLETERAAQLNQISAYDIGHTTFEAFLADGWSTAEVYKGKIGIVALTVGAASNAEIFTKATGTCTLGSTGLMSPGNARVAEVFWDAQIIAVRDKSLNVTRIEYSALPVNLDSGSVYPTVACTLTFAEGVLSNIVYGESGR